IHSPQLHMLEHFTDFLPNSFCAKLHVTPKIFNCILDQITNHPIFQTWSNHSQLPVAIQLAIFLNHAGHYGNATTLEDLCQCPGVSVGSVINCMSHVMVALLDQHDEFIAIPMEDSEDMELSWQWVESRSCHSWQNSVFTADGSMINLHEKLSVHGEMFWDRKLCYSLNCQVNENLPHIVHHKLSHATAHHYAPHSSYC
ncbi:hypothetical protein PISMIDRAFT_101106, partial [Pisolithus microcarpus 441]